MNEDFTSTFGGRIKCHFPQLQKAEKQLAQNGPFENPLGEMRQTMLIPKDCVKTLILENHTEEASFFEANAAGRVEVIPIPAKTILKYPLTDPVGGMLRGCIIQCPGHIIIRLDESCGNVPMFDPMDVFMKKEALKHHETTNWISVEESLPEKDLEVDVIAEGYFGKTSQLHQNKERHQFTGKFDPYYGWTTFFTNGPVKILCWKYIDEETRKILDLKGEEKNET
jgi:hypothetical protein